MDNIIAWSPGITLESIEKQIITAAFKHYRGNKTATANALGIAIRTLDNKFEKYAAEAAVEKERDENEQSKRTEFLARCRGFTTDSAGNIIAAEADPAGKRVPVTSGLGVESPVNLNAKSAVPLSERPKVQVVLPTQASAGRPVGRR